MDRTSTNESICQACHFNNLDPLVFSLPCRQQNMMPRLGLGRLWQSFCVRVCVAEFIDSKHESWMYYVLLKKKKKKDRTSMERTSVSMKGEAEVLGICHQSISTL